MQRHNGFIVGFDTNPQGTPIWKVRVKDPTSNYNGQKFTVASVHEGLELARGINVHFVIGTIDDPSGSIVPRAIDVCPKNFEKNTTTQTNKRSGGQL